MKYLTPSFYRTVSDGLDLTGVSDLVLAIKIGEAEALIDSHCKVPSLAPTTVTDEIHEWNGLSRRIRFYCDPVPVTSITRFLIQISTDSQGNMLEANVNPDDVVINHDEGYAEVVSMTTLTMGLTPVLINLGLSPALVHVDYSAGYSYSVSGETLFDSGDHTVYQALRPLWDASPTILVNGSAQSTGFTLDLTNGTVTFDSPRGVTDVVTASYTYHVPDDVRAAAIVTTTALLGERRLNQAGLTNLARGRGGRSSSAERPLGASGTELPQRAKDLLSNYVHYSLAGA